MMTSEHSGETFLEKIRLPAEPGAPLAAVSYPNSYRTGMSNLGLHFLYSALSETGRFRVERRFLDGMTGEVPDVFFFTVSYEEDLLNIVRILAAHGVEPLREKRDGGPIVVAGGPVVSSNPLPFFPIADILAAGEGEDILPLIAGAVASEGTDRRAAADRLRGTDGVLMPGFIEQTRPAGPVSPDRFQRSVILTGDTVFPGMLLVEISRGCPGACSFCMATSVYRPFRTVALERFESILDSAARALGGAPLKTGLVSTAAAAHPRFAEIVDSVLERGGSVGLSSLRASDIDARSAAAIGRAAVRSVSLAPESGSERVRMSIGKRSPDGEYLDAARLLREEGVSRFTLYMLSGLPGEDEEAIEESARFLGRFAAAAKGARVSVNLNALVPKPRTPLQFMAMAGRREMESSAGALRSACRAAGIAISVKGSRSSMNQAVIALGDEAAGRAAVRFAAGGTSWKKALRDEGLDPELIHEERGISRHLPWERVFGAEGKDALLARYRALKE